MFVSPYLTMILGRSIYLFPPSPKKIGENAFNIMDVRGVYSQSEEWLNFRGKFKEDLKKVETNEELFEKLNEGIKIAGGKYSFVMENQSTEETDRAYISPQVDYKDKVLYITVPEFMGSDEKGNEYANLIADSFKDKDLEGVVVDLRENGGGNMYPMILALSPLIPDEEILSFLDTENNKVFSVALENGSFKRMETYKISNTDKYLDIPVAILIVEKTASSAEMTLISFGVETAGYSFANTTIGIRDDYTVVLTTNFVADREDKNYGEEKISPDFLTETPLEDS